jgi:GTP-dependent phosphoenolpyruvate carboxykinase
MYLSASDSIKNANAFNFNINPNIWSNSVIGDDNAWVGTDPDGNAYNVSVFMYICKDTSNSTYIILADSTDSWFTVMKTNVTFRE